MAEDVILLGINPGIPQWATETTQKKILDNLDDQLDLTEDIKKSLSKILKLLTAQSKNLKNNAGGQGNNQNIKSAEEELREIIKKLTESKDVLEEHTEEVDKNTSSQKKYRGIMGDLIKSCGDLIAKGFGKLMYVAGLLAGAILNQLDIFHELNRAGADLSTGLSGGLTSLAELSEMSQMTFGDLRDVMVKFGQAVHRYGTKQFATTIGNVREEFNSLGYTVQETADFLGGYLEAQRLLGFTQTMSQQQLAQSAKESAENTVKWSSALGKSREQLEEQMKDAASKFDVQNFVRSIADPKLREKIQNAIDNLSKSIDNPELLEGMLQMLAAPVPEAVPVFREILEGGGSELGFALKDFIAGIKQGQTSTMEEVAAGVNMLGDVSSRLGREYLGTILPVNQVTGTVIKFANSLEDTRNQYRKMTDEERAAAIQTEKNRNAFYDSLTDLRAQFDQIIGRVFGTGDVFTVLTGVIVRFTQFIKDNEGIIINFLTEAVDKLVYFSENLDTIDDEIAAWWKGAVDSVKTEMLNMFAQGGALALGILAMFKVVTAAITESIKSSGSSLMDMFSGGDGGDDGAGGRRDPRRNRGRRGFLGGLDKGLDFLDDVAGKLGKFSGLFKLGGKLLLPFSLLMSFYDIMKGAFESGAKAMDENKGFMGVFFATIMGGITGFFSGIADMLTSIWDLGKSLFSGWFGEGEKANQMAEKAKSLNGTGTAQTAPGNYSKYATAPSAAYAYPTSPANSTVTTGAATASQTNLPGATAASAPASDVSTTSSKGIIAPVNAEKENNLDTQMLSELKKLNRLNQEQLNAMKSLSVKSAGAYTDRFNNASYNN